MGNHVFVGRAFWASGCEDLLEYKELAQQPHHLPSLPIFLKRVASVKARKDHFFGTPWEKQNAKVRSHEVYVQIQAPTWICYASPKKFLNLSALVSSCVKKVKRLLHRIVEKIKWNNTCIFTKALKPLCTLEISGEHQKTLIPMSHPYILQLNWSGLSNV